MTEQQFFRWQKWMRLGRKLFHCHQLPERSFYFRGMQFPVCARCTGLILGFCLFGPIVTVFTFGNMYLSLGLIAIMVLDGALQLKNILPSTNFRRVLTGTLAGYACFSIVAYIMKKLIELAA